MFAGSDKGDECGDDGYTLTFPQALASSLVKTNDRMRRKFSSRIAPDSRVEAVVALKGLKGPATVDRKGVLARYMARYGLTDTLRPTRLLSDQWLVLTEHRILLFTRKGSGLISRIGSLEHELERTDVELLWADFTEATLRKRLIHLTTTDQRMNVSQTVIAQFDEADLFVQAVGDRGREIGLQEL